MINYKQFISELSSKLERVPENRRLDWLENAIDFVSSEVDTDDKNLSPEQREEKIKWRVSNFVNRMNKFTKSDIGPLYLNFIGQYSMRSATDIVQDKLCINYPESVNGNMMRGKATKPVAKDLLINKHMESFELENYMPALEAIREMDKNSGIEDHVWMNGCYPDGVYIDKNQETWLVSYTSPSKESTVIELKENIPEERQAAIVLEKLQIEEALRQKGINKGIDHLLLVAFSSERWDIETIEFESTTQMEVNILDAGDYYWDMVLSEKLPVFKSAFEFEYIHEIPEPLANLNAKFAYYKKMESKAKSNADTLKSAIEEQAKRFGIDFETEGKKTRFGGIDVKNAIKRSLDMDKLKADFIAKGGDITDDILYNVEVKPLTMPIKTFLKEKGLDMKTICEPGTKKTDPVLMNKAYIDNGGQPNDPQYFQVKRTLSKELLKASYLIIGGQLDSDLVNSKSITPTISLVRVKETGHQPFLDEIDEIASAIIEEGLPELKEVVKGNIHTIEAVLEKDPNAKKVRQEILTSGESIPRDFIGIPKLAPVIRKNPIKETTNQTDDILDF